MIRRAHAHESPALSALAFRSKAHWGYDQAFMEAHREWLAVPVDYMAAHPTYVFEDAGAIIGFYALRTIEPGLVELDYLFVEPAHLGRGIGKRLLGHALQTAQALGHHTMRIVSDPHAIGFYQRMGARLWGEWHSSTITGRRLPVLELACVAPE